MVLTQPEMEGAKMPAEVKFPYHYGSHATCL